MKTKHFRAWPQEMGGKMVLCLVALQLAGLPLRAAEAATAVEVMSQAGTVISNGPAASEPAPSLWDEINKAISETFTAQIPRALDNAGSSAVAVWLCACGRSTPRHHALRPCSWSCSCVCS